MNVVEKVAKTIDDAITEALIELGATTEEVDIEIIEKGSKGILGFGAKLAKVRVAKKQSKPEEIPPVSQVIPKETVTKVEPVTEQPTLAKTEEATDRTQTIQSATNFLTKVTKEMGIDAAIEAKMEDDAHLHVNLSGDNMGNIIGRRGETLDALQYLTNVVINKGKDDYIRVMLDTENYRARREETLRKLAMKLAKKAQQTRRAVILEPMNPYDRRIIHSALQNSKSVKTHSEGKEPFRKVVITPILPNKSYK